MLGHRHAALDTDANALAGLGLASKQFVQQGPQQPPGSLDGSNGRSVGTEGSLRSRTGPGSPLSFGLLPLTLVLFPVDLAPEREEIAERLLGPPHQPRTVRENADIVTPVAEQ